jgi:DNA-binding NarL/FixJ family response regulator
MMVSAAMIPRLLVVVRDLNVLWPGVGPPEADPPFLVHPDAVLTRAIAAQLFQPVSRRHPQISQYLCSVQHRQLPPISPSVTVRLLRHLAPARTRTAAAPAQPFTDRETEVIQAIARGRTNQEIADELFISLSTVKSHLTSVQRKLGARNRVEIAAWAWESRLMESPRQ